MSESTDAAAGGRRGGRTVSKSTPDEVMELACGLPLTRSVLRSVVAGATPGQLGVLADLFRAENASRTESRWTGNGVLDRFLEDESLFGEFLRTPVSEGGVESLVVEPPHIVVEVGA